MRRAFYAARRYAARVVPWLGQVGLKVGCRVIEKERKDTPGLEGERAFAHVGHVDGVVCVSEAARLLPVQHQLGLVFHEFGHMLAAAAGGPSDEPDADIAVLDILGLSIGYSKDLRLQFLPLREIRRVIES